nr:type II toxin-antitoxin system death-on-curing family toxin [uncultured Methanospirillum sp.]
MSTISVNMLLNLHYISINMYGGIDGILYEATLDFIVEKCNQGNGPIQMSAILLYDISTMHPFEDGNKRTAVYAATMVLEQYGFSLTADEDEVIRMGLALARYEMSLEETILWIQQNSRSTDPEPQAPDYT